MTVSIFVVLVEELPHIVIMVVSVGMVDVASSGNVLVSVSVVEGRAVVGGPGYMAGGVVAVVDG